MSRDHYKGSKKNRDARVGPDGKVGPLSKSPREVNLSVDSLSISGDSTHSRRKFIYARASGNDVSGEGTLDKPYRTFARCVEDVPHTSGNVSLFIDISGIGEETIDGPFTFPSFSGKTYQEYMNVSVFGLPSETILISPINIIASPTAIEEITITSQSAAPETRVRSYTVSGASWLADQFKGKLIALGDGASVSRIVSSTEDTLHTLTTSSYTGPATIMEESAVITAGFDVVPDDYEPLYSQNFDFTGIKSSMTVFGVKFLGRQVSSINSSVNVSDQKSSFYSCSFQGIYSDASFLSLTDCHLDEEYLYLYGGGISSSSTFFEGTTMVLSTGGATHAQKDEFLYCLMLGCSAIGNFSTAAGTGPSEMKFLRNTVISGTGVAGVYANNNSFIHVEECLLQDNAGHGVFAETGAVVEVYQCLGTGNGGYGVRIDHGSQARITDPTTVTGDLGDFKVGVLPPDTWTNFNSGFQAVVDTTAVSGTLSRIYNTDSY